MAGVANKFFAIGVAWIYVTASVAFARGYAFNEIVPDVRQSPSASGGSACPVRSHQLVGPGSIAFRWSTALKTNPATLLTSNPSVGAQLDEIEQAVAQSFATWTNIAGTTLTSNSFAPLTRVAVPNACAADGINSICFAQPDAAFTPGVLAFTRVVTADQTGVSLGNGPPAAEVGEILDADIYFNPSNSFTTFATPAALSTNPGSYDLQSILTHEIGHALGFSHSAVWSAMMFPYAPAPGTFTGTRPTAQQPDAPLGDDDRAGLRVLYHDPNDATFIGSISGRIVPANPLALPAAPPGVTGIFGAHVVALDAASGAVVAATLGGWSCIAPGPAQFDGSYEIGGLSVGRSYKVYAEPLDGAVSPAQVSNALETLCRNGTTDTGWPATQSCVVPRVATQFSARTLP